MAKLRKPRPSTSTLPDSPQQHRTRTGSIISTSSSSHIPSTSSSTPPIALRIGRKSAPSLVQPSVDVSGEFEFGDHDQSIGKIKSNSSTHSTDSLPHSSPSTKRTHSRNPSNSSSTLPSTSPTQSHSFPTSNSMNSISTSTSGSALSQLRQRLDDDQLARENKGKGKGHVLKKKKRHDEGVVEREDEGTQTADEQEEVEISEGTQTEPIPSKEEEEEGLVEVEVQVMTVVEETEEVLEEEQEEEDSTKSNELDLYSTQTNTSPSTPSSAEPTPQFQTQSSSILGNSIVFAPARLGWRVASGTVGFGLDTTKSVVRHVPIVGRLVPAPSRPQDQSQTRTREEEEQIDSLPSPPISSTESEPISFAPSTIDKQDGSIVSENERDEHGLVYRTAELGLGLGIASVLVGNALTRMAWRRLTTGSGQTRKE